MLDLTQASAQDPGSDETQLVLKRRPHPLVIPRSGIVQPAQDIVWDLRENGRPKPLDFCAPNPTHLNLGLLARWRDRWPDYPDQEIFSHLIDGVDFKVEGPDGLLLQPHLTSLTNDIVSVHKELQRLTDLGFFSCHSWVPFVPWRTFPNGAVTRKYEERWRRTTDAGAPRRGLAGSRWMVDGDGRQVFSVNQLTVHPELRRGTSPLLYDSWQATLAPCTPGSPPRKRDLQAMSQPATEVSGPGEVLYLFSGPNKDKHSLAALLRTKGRPVHQVDVCLSSEQDLTLPAVVEEYKQRIASGKVSFVFLSPPCKSFSVAAEAERGCLRTRGSPWGIRDVPPAWRKLGVSIWRTTTEWSSVSSISSSMRSNIRSRGLLRIRRPGTRRIRHTIGQNMRIGPPCGTSWS